MNAPLGVRPARGGVETEAEAPVYRIAVRALCEFTAKRGDLDLRFTPAPSAREGMEGHATVAARRGDHYQREVPLQGAYRQLRVRGRADGYDPLANRLEEVKTYRGDLARQPDNHRQLHWAQARVYGWLLCQERGLRDIELALVYYDVASGRETPIVQRHSADALRDFFEAQCAAFLDHAERELAHRLVRDASLATLAFPLEAFRHGQRALAEAVYKAACTGVCLLAQAPTGIGKTLGTLFPQLKAMPGQALDKLFYLAAKTSGRQLALEALSTLNDAGATLRGLELIARDKACEHPDKACHGESCPLARGFYDRLPAARAAALAHPGLLDRERLRELARGHGVCPYYLGQELARWCDVAVGDYNYFFDASALLHGLAQANGWRVALLVDEAHNLVERARQMYSAELDQGAFLALRAAAPEALKRPLERIARAWRALAAESQDDYQAFDQPPAALLGTLLRANGELADFLAEQPAAASPELLRFHFDTLAFLRLAESFGEHSLFDIHRRPGRGGRTLARLCLRNLLPAPFLAPRFAAVRSAVLFSATLAPARFQRDLLGLPPGTPWLDVDSPFNGDQLSVRLARHISTRYAERGASLEPIAALMARQYAERPGNYLAFFSSFDYLQRVLALFQARHPGCPVWSQVRGMSEEARRGFLERFAEDGRGIGFAVLGGAFGEGIDLPGERLVGAFVATLGLPQVNPVNEQMRQRLERLFGRGYDYAYLVPGLQKVVQAAGRVIRTPQDRGVVHLIDDRFARADVLALLPAWWEVR